MNILVTGANGQLGLCLKDIRLLYDHENNYKFLDKTEFDLENKAQMYDVFKKLKPDVVVNCAAYTNVEDSEENDGKKPFLINADGVCVLAKLCREYGTYLIHISTDYVFDGRKKTPYTEEDKTHPLNQYGMTKLIGERGVLDYNKGIVIRTSWLYSEYGHNFYKTILERIKNEKETNVVCDQIGTPTYAKDLAFFIVYHLIKSKKILEINGLYNYSNSGIASWYDFASSIETLYTSFGQYEPMRKDPMEINFSIESKKYISKTTSDKYPTKAKRPVYSVLDKGKTEKEFGVKPRHWTNALVECMENDKII